MRIHRSNAVVRNRRSCPVLSLIFSILFLSGFHTSVLSKKNGDVYKAIPESTLNHNSHVDSQCAWQHYRLEPQYIGDIQAVIFDWAGTTFDFGSVAPILALQQLFETNQVPITVEDARLPMGSEKKEHIRQLLKIPRIAEQWVNLYGVNATEEDIDRLYNEFVPYLIEAIRTTARPIPHLLRTMHYLYRHGYKIGSNTGYSREMIEVMKIYADEIGFKPQSIVCASDVPRGRPYPDMALQNALELGVDCVQACVKVDDTRVGIREGLSAGMWTIGVAISGNEVGLTEEQWSALTMEEQNVLRKKAYKNLYDAGAHYVIDSISTLSRPLKDIRKRLARGEKP